MRLFDIQIDREKLYPKEKEFSIVVIDMWDDTDNSAFKVLESDNDELKQSVGEVAGMFGVGYYVMVYDKKGITVNMG